jgi:glycine cleavage system H protein
MRPEDLKYSAEHEWIRSDGEALIIGITDHAAAELGDIVFLELPEAGAEFAPGDAMGTIETVKAVEELYSPVGGVVVDVNAAVIENPEKVNESPFEGGWLIKIKPDGREAAGLMDAAAYGAMVDAD